MAPPLDLYNPVEEAKEAALFIPDARYVEIPSIQGHAAAALVNASDVEFMNKVVGEFLDTVTDRGRKPRQSSPARGWATPHYDDDPS